jgi:hypothetical protein
MSYGQTPSIRPRSPLKEKPANGIAGSSDLPLIRKIRPLDPLALTLYKHLNILHSPDKLTKIVLLLKAIMDAVLVKAISPFVCATVKL